MSWWLVTVADARINVVTLPDRDTVQLTIYNSADLTLVKETRVLTFKKGVNKLEFSLANTLIDPTSVEFQAKGVDVLDVSFPARVTNTLEWRIKSEVAGEVTCEIRYFTSGISWSADYVAEADRQEKQMVLAGYVRVNNQSGEDYENAQVRLVVGIIRLVEEIRRLAQSGPKPAPDPFAAVPNDWSVGEKRKEQVVFLGSLVTAERKAAEIVKEGMSEYFLYTVGGRDTIPTGWSKRFPSFRATDVPITSYYKFERERWGDRVMRFYRFTNDAASKLGTEPLPDGQVKAFRTVTADKLYGFVGRTNVKYIPVGEQVEMELGEDREVTIKPRLMNWEKVNFRFDDKGNVAGWATKEMWEIEVQNSKDIPVTLDIRRNFTGDWQIATAQKYEKVDAGKVKFVLPLKSCEKQKFTYELTTRYGTNVQK